MKKLLAAAVLAAITISVLAGCTVIGNNGSTPAPVELQPTFAPHSDEQTTPEPKDDPVTGKIVLNRELKNFGLAGVRLDGDKVEKSNGLPFSRDNIRGDFLAGECITLFLEGNFGENAFTDTFAAIVPHSARINYNKVAYSSISGVKLAEGRLEVPNEEGLAGSVTVPEGTEPGIYDLLISANGRIVCCIVINISAE